MNRAILSPSLWVVLFASVVLLLLLWHHRLTSLQRGRIQSKAQYVADVLMKHNPRWTNVSVTPVAGKHVILVEGTVASESELNELRAELQRVEAPVAIYVRAEGEKPPN